MAGVGLVLTRKAGQRIWVGCEDDAPEDAVVVTVCAIEGGRVKLGIAAPGDVEIYREEIAVQKGLMA